MRMYTILIVSVLLIGCFTGISSGTSEKQSSDPILDLVDINQPAPVNPGLKKQVDGYFTENKGQWNSDLHFIGRTSFGYIGFGTDSIFFDLRKVEIQGNDNSYDEHILPDQISDEMDNVKISGHVVKYSFKGSNNIIPTGIDPMDHKCNYFYGNDPDKWVRGAQSFRSVVYKNLYDDIDLRYYFNKEGTKYDFILNPGSDPKNILVEIEGHDFLSVKNDELSIQVKGKEILADRDLISFYDNDNSNIIKSNFMEIGENLYSFEIGNYQKDRIVIIDPLVFSTFTGKEGEMGAIYSDLDPLGNINLFGHEVSMDMYTTPGAYNDTYSGGTFDYFVKKLKNDGSDLIFSTYIGGNGKDEIRYTRFDPDGNLILFGRTNSDNFPTTHGSFSPNYSGDTEYDITVTKLKEDGTDLIFSTYVGGSDKESIFYNTIDEEGNILMSGITESSDYPLEAAIDSTFAGGSDGDLFLTKLKSDGSALIFSTYFGGSNSEYPGPFKFDPDGNILITGNTRSRLPPL